MHGFFIKRTVTKRLQTVGMPYFSVFCKLSIQWITTDNNDTKRRNYMR